MKKVFPTIAKITKLFLISITFLFAFSCSQNPDDSTENDKEETSAKLQAYKSFLGTYYSGHDTIIVSENSVSYNGEKISLDNLKTFDEFTSDDYPAKKTLCRVDELNTSWKYIYENTEYPDLGELNKKLPTNGEYEKIEEYQTSVYSIFKHWKSNDLFLKLSDSDFLYFYKSDDEMLIQLETYGSKDIDLYKWTVIYDCKDNGMYPDKMTEREKPEKVFYKTENVITCDVTEFKKQGSSSESGGVEENTTTLSGNYTITEASSSTITFSNGNWTYSYKGKTQSGTYSQNDGEITIAYSQGSYTVEGVFTVSKDNETITLTGKSDDCTAIISSVFMISDSSALQNKTVTLTEN